MCTGRRVTIINIAGHTECYCHGDSGTVTCNKMYHWLYWRRIYLASGLVMGFVKGLRGSNPCQINILTTQTPYTMARGEEGGGRREDWSCFKTTCCHTEQTSPSSLQRCPLSPSQSTSREDERRRVQTRGQTESPRHCATTSSHW